MREVYNTCLVRVLRAKQFCQSTNFKNNNFSTIRYWVELKVAVTNIISIGHTRHSRIDDGEVGGRGSGP